MSYASDASNARQSFGLERLDDLSPGAWIAIMVISFIIFWPIGLGILGYLLWSGKMQSWKRARHCGRRRSAYRRHSRPTGNSAFDDYRTETLKRLEEEQEAFHEFVEQLRRAKDKEEFDRFMASRTAAPEGPSAQA